MKWLEHKALSEQDMDWLATHPMMERLLTNRLAVMFKPGESIPSFKEMGLYEVNEPYYTRKITDTKFEILFSSATDMDFVSQKLTLLKIKYAGETNDDQ